MLAGVTLLDDLLPRSDFSEHHERLVAAPADRVWEAVQDVTPGEMPAVRLLFGLRSLAARLAGGDGLPDRPGEPLLAQMLASGFARLAEEPGRELVCGVVAQMWGPGGELAEIRGGAEFVAFDRPGFAKAAMSFRLLDEGLAGTRLETETRVLATDAGARCGFGRYWRFIRPASGIIRRLWLRAIARRAARSVDRVAS